MSILCHCKNHTLVYTKMGRKLQQDKIKKDILRAINNPTKFKHEYFKTPLNYLKKTTNYIKEALTSMKRNVNVSTLCNICVDNCSLLFDCFSLELASTTNDLETEGIYNNLRALCRSVDTECVTPNLFIQTEVRGTARHYASQIWNRRRAFRINTYNYILFYVKKYIGKAFNVMTETDIEIIQCLLEGNDYIVKDIFELFDNIQNIKCVPMFLHLLHQWFLIMPILEELSKYIPWRTLMDIRSYRLDPDQLYSILLTIFYKNED